ncbi:MAG: glycosyltransferase family 2 protein [Actinobacteria bacterium]|nr:glycosyltransferase family 2 protein [Actinomycetota bacterium]
MQLIERGALRAPARVFDIDVAHRYGGHDTVDTTRFNTAWCLVRRHGVAEAVRFLDIESEGEIGLAALRDVLDDSVKPLTTLPVAAVDGPTLTVVICTRDRREGLLQTLRSLAGQSDRAFDVLVVDNSHDGAVAHAGLDIEGLIVRCCHEPMPGLSRARNRGLAEVTSDIIAWIDDDEVADPDWIAWLKRGFATPGAPDAVAGVMLPAELETPAQVNFERYGGFNKGRGMTPERLRAGTPSVPDPLYPLPGFGAGGNMAFRTAALRAVGGFDNRLGAGTLTHGGEETRALALILESGATVLHWPPAVTWHYHRRSDEALEKQFFGYSAGLTAFYMSMLMSSPAYAWRIVRFIPPGVRRVLANRGSGAPDGPPPGFPDHLLQAGRRGLLRGAWLYVGEVRRQRRAVPARAEVVSA